MLLSLSKSYVFRVLFQQFFLTVVFGLAHGMMLLPVLLATVGPRCYASAETTARGSIEFGGGERRGSRDGHGGHDGWGDGGEGGGLDDDGDLRVGSAGTSVDQQPEGSVDYQLEDR